MGIAIHMIERIKVHMKKNRITYKVLADRLGVSEATIKRSFARRAFTLERIDQICDVLAIEARDLMGDVSGISVREYLSREQEEYLAENIDAFAVFYFMVSKVPLDIIQERLKLTDSNFERLLLRFDKMDLIELRPGNAVHLKVQQGAWWTLDGPLTRKFGADIRQDYLQSRFDGEFENLWFVSGDLTPSSLEIFRKKQEQLYKELKELILLDSSESHRKKKNISFIAGFRPWLLPQLREILQQRSLAK